MAKAGVFVCLVIVIVDVAAGILSIQAENAKDKVNASFLTTFSLISDHHKLCKTCKCTSLTYIHEYSKEI